MDIGLNNKQLGAEVDLRSFGGFASKFTLCPTFDQFVVCPFRGSRPSSFNVYLFQIENPVYCNRPIAVFPRISQGFFSFTVRLEI